METIPEILKNPNNPSFLLEDTEIYNLKEAKELIDIGKLTFSLFTIYSCVVINIQRRIEFFNIQEFLDLLKDKNQYNKNANTLKERWLNISDQEILNNAQNLNIINTLTSNLINSLYWMKSNTNQNKSFSVEEIYSIVYLLEQNLFLIPFKEDKRKKVDDNSHERNRRKDDFEETSQVATTHEELILKNGVKNFEQNLGTNDKNDKLLTAYI